MKKPGARLPLCLALTMCGLATIPGHQALAAKADTKTAVVTPAEPQQQKPNIVIIWGDDIGQTNVSAYSKGMMGYKTPNIDRVANEGVIFTDY